MASSDQAKITKYQRAQQQEAKKCLSRRLEENCPGFDVSNEHYLKLYQEIQKRLKNVDILCQRVTRRMDLIQKLQKQLLELFHFIAVELKELYRICERAHALLPEINRPSKKEYLVQFFEATRVC